MAENKRLLIAGLELEIRNLEHVRDQLPTGWKRALLAEAIDSIKFHINSHKN